MSPALTGEIVERVRTLVEAIPPGQVATYGSIAQAAGLRSARTVGFILRTDGSDVPWHRVVRADGVLPAHLATKQTALLTAEGVIVRDGRVDMQAHRFRG
ncbi:MGMT family protein [Hoyosella sp. YIM 151337]|uniref:MGMT family protein n=1 Tax=Hoyosella sp. YIM 151337 TaxID=2992742 RepID=UPI0022356616|nr:MGMT family protein [Hoyosella sp. YIM 151337]MCW4352266.1 MGMT family protein [Hoyosella sp. YIM 151337]